MSASARYRLTLIVVCSAAISCDSPTRPDPNALTTLTIIQPAVHFELGQSSQFSVVATVASGQQAVGRPVEWESSEPSVASVSPSGVVTGVGIGSATIRASSEATRDSVMVTVGPVQPRDVRIVDARFTQGIQPSDFAQRFPLIRHRAAVLNVFVECAPACVLAVPVMLHVYAADESTLLHADTVLTRSLPSTTASGDAPDAQFLVPSQVVDGALHWRVEADPMLAVVGNVKDNDRFPAMGTLRDTTVDVPPLKLRFVPVELTYYSDAASITPLQVPEYLRLARSLYPLGTVVATIGPTVQSGRQIGGNAASFVAGVMADVDRARWLTESDPDVHWIGVLKRPPPPTVLSFGGMGYIPSSYSATGPGTRTVIVYQQGTRLQDMTSKEVVAHELGHNFGRWHTPCGGAPFPGAFPYAGGTIGSTGYDVFSFEQGLSDFASTIPATRGDVMGYCEPSWISDYTYEAVLNFRGTSPSLVAPSADPTRSLMISGAIRTDQRIQIDKLEGIDARPALPAGGRYRLRGLGSGAHELFSYSFDPPRVSTETDDHFFFVIPMSADLEGALERVEVIGPSGSATSRVWTR